MSHPSADETMRLRAKQILCAGGVVILPTDTVYGIGAHPNFPAAVDRICRIKGRPSEKPIALLASDPDAVEQFGAGLPPAAARLAARFWPGALTLVLPCRGGWEGFRVPAHDGTRQLIRICGGVLRVTSANLSGQMPACSAAETLRSIGQEADLIIDGGISPGGVASTVVKVAPENELTLLREGAIPREAIFAVAVGKRPCE